MFFIPFCIRMLKNKAQIAQERIKDPDRNKGTLGFTPVICDNLFCPPPPK